jgi:tRNA threonylcarbamoyladenosine biosynthesis protein TsaB
MKILGVEFSSSQRSVALAEGAKVLGRASETGGRNAIALIEEALSSARADREEVAAIAVGLGPGSYTGIRGAIALAQGWQLGRPVKVLGISSADCIAAEARKGGIRGILNVVIDAQRNEFYLAVFEIEVSSFRAASELRLASYAEIQAIAETGGQIAGPDIREWFPNAAPLFPDAGTLGELAAGREDFIPAENLQPIYLRETSFKKAPPPRIRVE